MEVNIKQELENLDRNSFNDVANLVDRILADITDIHINCGPEVMFGAIGDYMIDLINPDLLDFDSRDS